jgi:hypothetical protein
MGVNIWINRGRVYLDVYTRGRRRRERLAGLIITGNRAVDKETMRLAEIARAKRAQQVFSEEWRLVDPIAGRQTLYEYIEKAAGKKKEGLKSVLRHLEGFDGGSAAIGRIDERWVEDFQNYLLGKLSVGSAHTYSSVTRAALNQAAREKIIARNPAENVKRIKAPETERVWLNEEELARLAGHCQQVKEQGERWLVPLSSSLSAV